MTSLQSLDDQVNMLQLALSGDLDGAEAVALQLPQLKCDVFHHFGPGFCIREMHMPAGAFVIGHAHKHGLANSFVKGRVRLLQDGGLWEELAAPHFFVSKPGRKAAYVLEDSVWQNIIVTNETDPLVIEALFVEKSPQWEAANAAKEIT